MKTITEVENFDQPFLDFLLSSLTQESLSDFLQFLKETYPIDGDIRK